MPFVTNDALKLHYEIAGAGPPVLFMHGYTSTIALWRDQVPVLSPHYRLICMDLRGHGESEGTGMDGYNFAALAGDALAVLDQEGVERATIVGHSMGGMVAQELLARHGHRVAAAVLSSTTCKAPPREYFQPVVEWAVKLGDIPAKERAADPLTRSCKPVSRGHRPGLRGNAHEHGELRRLVARQHHAMSCHPGAAKNRAPSSAARQCFSMRCPMRRSAVIERGRPRAPDHPSRRIQRRAGRFPARSASLMQFPIAPGPDL